MKPDAEYLAEAVALWEVSPFASRESGPAHRPSFIGTYIACNRIFDMQRDYRAAHPRAK